jgi:hypothetical protein
MIAPAGSFAGALFVLVRHSPMADRSSNMDETASAGYSMIPKSGHHFSEKDPAQKNS